MKDDNWISMADQRPPYAGEYLVYGRLHKDYSLSVLTGRFCVSGRWYLVGTNQQLFAVTHWMRKPDGPKEEEAKDGSTIEVEEST